MQLPDTIKKYFHGWWKFGGALPLSARIVLGLLAWVGFLCFWEFAPRPAGAESLIPTFSQVVERLVTLFTEKSFLNDVAASLKRIGLSFLIAVLIAWPLAVAMGIFPVVEGFFQPLVSPMRYLPAPSFIPILLALLGTGDNQKIALLILGVVWFLLSLLVEDTKRISREWVEAAKTLGAGRFRLVGAVILPAAMPYYLDTMRQLLAVSWTYLVIAEIVASTDGIGSVMMRARRVLGMDTIMACILTIGLLGLTSDLLLRGLRWLCFPYLRARRT
jgi:NitT/TauT family transport system permease protein